MYEKCVEQAIIDKNPKVCVCVCVCEKQRVTKCCVQKQRVSVGLLCLCVQCWETLYMRILCMKTKFWLGLEKSVCGDSVCIS